MLDCSHDLDYCRCAVAGLRVELSETKIALSESLDREAELVAQNEALRGALEKVRNDDEAFRLSGDTQTAASNALSLTLPATLAQQRERESGLLVQIEALRGGYRENA